MGDTLEGQKKKAPRRRLFPSARIYRVPEAQKPKVQRYSSSKKLGDAFDRTLRNIVPAAQERRRNQSGKPSLSSRIKEIKGNILMTGRDDAGERGVGERLARKALNRAIEMEDAKDNKIRDLEGDLKRNDGGMAKKTRVF